MNHHPSDSKIQTDIAETEIILAVSRLIKIELTPQTICVGESSTVQIDGYNASESVVCEAYARIGKLNSGQERKLGNDILKLIFLERRLGSSLRKIIAIVGDDALAWLSGKSWHAAACREFGIEVLQVTLSESTKSDLEEAQLRQVMVNLHS